CRKLCLEISRENIRTNSCFSVCSHQEGLLIFHTSCISIRTIVTEGSSK
ncbi:unnamed protein product, partial [Musa textilis]